MLINGYNLVRKDRNRHGRGVTIYVSSVLPFKRLHFPHSKDLELVLVECFINSRILTIAGLYRPPNATLEVLEKLHVVLTSLRPRNSSNLVLCSDFNIQPSNNRSNNSFSYFQSDFQLTQVVNEPTRVGQSSSSMIDLIFLSTPNTLVSCGTLAPLTNSDHFTVQVYHPRSPLQILLGNRCGCIVKPIFFVPSSSSSIYQLLPALTTSISSGGSGRIP